MRLESLVFMPLMALSMAVASIVGQNLGARKVRRAFQAGWHVTWIGVGGMFICALALFALAPAMAATLSRDAETIGYTVSYLRINAIAEPGLAVAMILSGALQGAGDTRMPMWISIFSNWAIRIPLCWALALGAGFGPAGAWAAMTVSIFVMAALVTWRYQSGGWIKL